VAAAADPTRSDPAAVARRLGVSTEAVELQRAAAPVDLHIESFIWTRTFRYDLGRRHRHSALGGRLFGQVDIPRLRAADVAGAWMSIATNPLRSLASRRRTVRVNVARLRRTLLAADVDVVADAASFDVSRAAGRLACFIGIQGANAMRPDDIGSPALADVSRVTLVHLTRSRHGAASAPAGGHGGLRAEGRAMVEALREHRVLLDLAHASPRTFWDALDAHGPGAPVIVSHTGASGVRRSWRNLDDDQIRAIADIGGVVGVILHRGFLAQPGWRATTRDVVRHIERVIAVGGEDAAAIGSDYDGFILPPRGLRSVDELARLTQAMLDRGHSHERIRRVLGTNALRPLRALRPASASHV
jgi:membrane dipeptidase